MACLAAALLIGAWIVSSAPDRPALATLESTEGGVYRLIEGNPIALAAGARIEAGDLIRSNGGVGGVLALTDGSAIEMRSDSELRLHRADGNDGIGIRLLKGGIIINAAEQRSGRLYVETKDMTVSVVGTVFLVKAEEEGSRVAVIEGEVRVEQPSGARQLHPGDQVATSPSMVPVTVSEEISWSRNAEAHLALLQETLATARSQQTPERFDVVSIKPFVAPAPGPGVRGGGGGAFGGPGGPSCFSGNLQLDPGRVFVAQAPPRTR
jgi:hypothetical protein